MKKRFWALFLAVMMVVSVLPTTAFAAVEDDDVIYGTYEDNEWMPGEASINYDDGITLRKLAEPTKNSNEYQITLEVETSTTTTTVPAKAATVLVIDVSRSMEYCADCGGSGLHQSNCEHYDRRNNRVIDEQKRMTAAKTAALNFLSSYGTGDEGSGRWLAIVTFGTGVKTALSWTDVSGGAEEAG